MTNAYFTTGDGRWFTPTALTRGPWDVDACHAGPPTSLMVRSLERLEPEMRLARLWVDVERPIPMSGFRVDAEIERRGRTALRAVARLRDDEQTFATARSLHLRRLDGFDVPTAPVEVPDFERAVPGRFPISTTTHGQTAFPDSIEVRYDPDGGDGGGGPTTMWMRTVPILAGEDASGIQRLCPLADCGNGISYNDYLDRVLFINPDLSVSVFREPEGDWFCSRATSHWSGDGTGFTEATLFDRNGLVGQATQSLLLFPAG